MTGTCSCFYLESRSGASLLLLTESGHLAEAPGKTGRVEGGRARKESDDPALPPGAGSRQKAPARWLKPVGVKFWEYSDFPGLTVINVH